MTEFTPDNIEALPDGSVFVFGSNAQGHHVGGAARVAVETFGAIWGRGEGLQGQSCAIPTMEGPDRLREAVGRFLEFARLHRDKKFYVTKIGTGIAGYYVEEVAPLFAGHPANVILPREFAAINERGQQ